MKAIVIIANGWNAGWLGCYGNEWLTSPHVDRLAADSIVFDQHFAVSPAPVEWRRSLASGRFDFGTCSAHGPSLIHSLRQSGVRTVRIHDVRNEPEIAGNDWDINVAALRKDDAPPGEALSRAIAKQLKILTEQDQWLLWIETDRLVPPWSVSLDRFDPYAEEITAAEDGEAPQPWDEPPLGPSVLNDREIEWLQATFASVVTEWDADLGRWIELFRKHDLAESALWMVTSGYGLSLGEHDWLGPTGNGLYEEMAHLPLLVRLPGAEQAGRRVPELTASVDLLPTLGEAFGVAFRPGIHGKSLLALARGSRKPVHSYLCQHLADGQAALRTPDWAFLHVGNKDKLLFRKPEDRWEVNDASMQHLEWADHVEATLHEFIEKAQDEPFIPPVLKDYDQVIQEAHPKTENQHEHGTTGERNDGPSQGESGVRGHQGDEEN